MASLTKKQKDNYSKIETGVRYSMTDALSLVKDCATAKFDESIDVSINLGIDSNKSCLLYTSPSPRDYAASRMPSSA